MLPEDPAGLGRDRLHRADLIGSGRDLRAHREVVERVVVVRHDPGAGIPERHVHRVGQRRVRACLPVLAPHESRTDHHLLALALEDHLRVLGDRAGRAIDGADDVLGDGRFRPEELPRLAVERVDNPGLAGNAGHDAPLLARPEARVDPVDDLGVRRHRGIDEQPFERMIEVPAVVQVLVVPDDLASVGVKCERRVVVQVLIAGPADHELGGGRGDRGAHVDQVQFGIEARDHPRADVLPFLERDTAPALVPRLARRRDSAPAPQFFAGACVVRHDDAGVRPPTRRAAPARDDLAVGDDRAAALVRRIDPVVEDLGFPGELAGRRVEREDIVVAARINDLRAVNGQIPVQVGEDTEHVVLEVVRADALIAPVEVTGRGVYRLDDVARVRHVEHAVVHEWRPLLQPRPKARATRPSGVRPHWSDRSRRAG